MFRGIALDYDTLKRLDLRFGFKESPSLKRGASWRSWRRSWPKQIWRYHWTWVPRAVAKLAVTCRPMPVESACYVTETCTDPSWASRYLLSLRFGQQLARSFKCASFSMVRTFFPSMNNSNPTFALRVKHNSYRNVL